MRAGSALLSSRTGEDRNVGGAVGARGPANGVRRSFLRAIARADPRGLTETTHFVHRSTPRPAARRAPAVGDAMKAMLGWFAIALVGVVGCGSSDTSGASGGGAGATADPAQTPPEGDAAITSWLDAGYYMAWHCQAAAHASTPPSPHGFNRICSNDLLAGAGATGDFPEGSSNVKELWDSVGGSVVGHAVYLKTAADSAEGASWYYFEFNPSISATAPVADGLGDSGAAKSVCVGCHIAAGPSFAPTSRDFVYTQVE
jgi:hypothetical protein